MTRNAEKNIPSSGAARKALKKMVTRMREKQDEHAYPDRPEIDSLHHAMRRYIDEPHHPPQNRLPFLLIRSCLGDTGTRPPGPGPFSNPWWVSPDIWYCQGPPAAAPAIPPTQTCEVIENHDHTVYAHVWNLGVLPIAGACVEFFSHTPSFQFFGVDSGMVFIGRANVNLGPRNSSSCHALVKCPVPWRPQGGLQGHSCLVVRVHSPFGDPLGPDPWNCYANRHVASHNCTVIQSGSHVSDIINSLEKALTLDTTIQIIQAGREAKTVLNKMIPGMKITPGNIQSRLLGEADISGNVMIRPTAGATAPERRSGKTIAMLAPRIAPAQRKKAIRNILKNIPLLSLSGKGRVTLAAPLKKNHAIVLHIVSRKKATGLLIGGYTFIIK